MDHIDVVPGFKVARDFRMRRFVRFTQVRQRFAGKHDAPAERVVGPIPFEDGDIVRSIGLLYEDGEVHARGSAADNVDFHFVATVNQPLVVQPAPAGRALQFSQPTIARSCGRAWNPEFREFPSPCATAIQKPVRPSETNEALPESCLRLMRSKLAAYAQGKDDEVLAWPVVASPTHFGEGRHLP